MIERIIAGIIENWLLVTVSFLMLVVGTATAYKRYGLKRVLLGKKNDNRELIYRSNSGKIIWTSTAKTWIIILTGGMKALTLFLLIMLLALAFIYQHDIQATRDNDNLLCEEFGTIYPTQEQIEVYYGRIDPDDLNISIKLGDNNDRRT